MGYIPEQGDIIWLSFDPSSGKEIIKRRPAYVISRKLFNEHTGLALVAPISSTVRGIKLEVVLDDSLNTQGAILIHQVKSLDFVEREAEFIECTSQATIDKVKTLIKVIVD
ncbi:MAG: type II toxin-antitoxin system PemK/MazF family toxin [Methylococcaceae bacterium]|jgi:mRNA-degrading endonuclease toxin of MazEF toxin-antitoxin module|nr:type II toxin-antitoxin system PemK/MazF family toxin [Methylococcaceae bacterium]